MLGEREAVVVRRKPWDVHGVGYVDVTVTYWIGCSTRLAWAQSVPEDPRRGERRWHSRRST